MQCILIQSAVHPRSLILAPIESAFLLVIISNLGPILLCFRDIADFLLRTATGPLFDTNLEVFFSD